MQNKTSFLISLIFAGINMTVGQIIGCNHARNAYKPVEAIVQNVNKDSYKDIVLKTKTGKEFVFYGTKDHKYLSESQLEQKLQDNYSVNQSTYSKEAK
jgi:hypothetical protein